MGLDNSSAEISVELLHWVVEDIIQAGEEDFSLALLDHSPAITVLAEPVLMANTYTSSTSSTSSTCIQGLFQLDV